MYTHTSRYAFITLLAPIALAACASEPVQTAEQKPVVENTQVEEARIATSDHTASSKARYTMHDEKNGGCMDPEMTGICSHFATKQAVYFSAGPKEGGLADGEYSFAVVVPGYQNGAYKDGIDGNLSDAVAGGTTGDDGTGDHHGNRTFTVKDHEIVAYSGQHRLGTSEGGRKLINLGVFDDSPNPGGLYVLTICSVQALPVPVCKYDAFVVGEEVRPHRARVAGAVYYDANTDGHLNPGEAPLADFHVKYSNGVKENKKDAMVGTEPTALDGNFAVMVEPDELTFWLEPPKGNWMQTGNLANQAVMFDRSLAALDDDMSYGLTVEAASLTDGVFFGAVCMGGGGARDAAFWGGMAPLAMLGPDELALLRELNLRRANGMPFDPETVPEFKDWLNNASAANMASRLSAQLAVMALNVEKDFVDREALIFAPDTRKANDNGFAHVADIIGEADATLSKHGLTVEGGLERTHQEHLMNALADANTNKTFVQSGPMSCSTDLGTPR